MTFYIQPLDDAGQTSLQNIVVTTFLQGGCGYLAMALHQGLGWQLVKVVDDTGLIHVAVSTPQGTFWDARGEVKNLRELVEPFAHKGRVYVHSTSAEGLAEEENVTGHQIETALGLAQVVWPNLPWLPDTPRGRAQAFAQELEALSRKHGMWIRDGIIQFGDSEEDGYVLGSTLSGYAFTITRHFPERRRT